MRLYDVFVLDRITKNAKKLCRNGIKAIKSLHEDNNKNDIPSNNMTTFVLLNTASLQLIPSSMIALRAMYGSSSPSSIVIPIWIVTGLSLIAGIISIKILNKRM